jgi:hypothetical protein
LRPERAWARTLAARRAAGESGETPVERANAAVPPATEAPATRSAPDKRPRQQPAIHRVVVPDPSDDEQQGRVSPTWRSPRVVLAVAWVGITAVALVAAELSGNQAAPTSAVAAATDVPATTDVAVTTIQETFDGLPMDSPPGAGWVVNGGDGASVVALPTSVDRSIRVRSSTQGGAATACRAIDEPAPALRVGFDLLIGRPPPSSAPVVSVRGRELGLFTLGVDRFGWLVAIDGSGPTGSSPDPDAAPSEGWSRVDLRIDGPAGVIEWRAHDVTGAEVAIGTSRIADVASAAVHGICFHSPQGTPSGWIAIDDLIVEG